MSKIITKAQEVSDSLREFAYSFRESSKKAGVEIIFHSSLRITGIKADNIEVLIAIDALLEHQLAELILLEDELELEDVMAPYYLMKDYMEAIKKELSRLGGTIQ